MIYSPQKIKSIIHQRDVNLQNLECQLNQWKAKLKDLEYSKKKELHSVIELIENFISSAIEKENMLYTTCLSERDSVYRLKYKNEKLKKFIRNQGFNPNDFEWVNIDQI